MLHLHLEKQGSRIPLERIQEKDVPPICRNICAVHTSTEGKGAKRITKVLDQMGHIRDKYHFSENVI